MRKLRITGTLDLFLAFAIIAIILLGQTNIWQNSRVKTVNTASASQEPSSYEIAAKRDLLALMMAYPEHIKGLEKEKDSTIAVIMQSGKKIIYDDKIEKNYVSKLANADIQDMMEQVYPLSEISTIMQDDFDPGRIRCYSFLKDVYGGTAGETTANLTNVVLGSKNLSFSKNNNASTALKTTFNELSGLVKSNSNIYGFVYPVNGTYNYRVIAGTNQLSPHAFGIAIDLKSNKYDYWKWATKEQGQSRLNSYPKELVRAFENNNFVWGGKWAHFDILHFEYRPELIIKSRYYLDLNSKIEPWYLGYPDTELAKKCIKTIDNALG